MIIETVYLGRDNAIDLQLTADGSASDLTSVTRMSVCDVGGAWSVDSDTVPAAFDWGTSGETGKISLMLGAQNIPPGTYTCRLTVYDPTNANGLVWGILKITFVSATCGG